MTSTVLAATFVWELYRDFDSGIQDFALWTLILHFLYFQLPLKSRALAFFHPLSFCGSIVIPSIYVYKLIKNPNYEVEHMNSWDLPWSSIVTRSLVFNLAPLVFHAIDITSNQDILISAYQLKPQKAQYFICAVGKSS